MTTLLDTNVLSELLRSRPEPAVLRWIDAQPPLSLHVSAVTQAEMLLGARHMPAGKRQQQLQAALDAIFAEDFAGRVWPFDSGAATHFAAVIDTRRRAGRPMSQFDAQIAAIALHRGAQLVTRSTRDFEGCGLGLLDPWQTV
jgi:predicted nucleic acid-binding protein